MAAPLVSVIIPTYNRADKMARAVLSVVTGDFTDWEIIIVDDGSTDHTASKIAELKNDHPQIWLTCVTQKNAGPATARNTGVQQSHGEIIVYLDSDDVFYPHALQKIAGTLQNQATQYGFPNHSRTLVLLNSAGQELARKPDTSGIHEHVTLQDMYDWKIKTTSSGLFHRKSVFVQGVSWRSGFWIEDLDFILQMGTLNPEGFCHIPETLVDYVQTYGADGLCSNARYLDWAHAFGTIYELHKNDPLMKNPHIYLDRVEKYKQLHEDDLQGKVPPQKYKFFPEYFEKLAS